VETLLILAVVLHLHEELKCRAGQQILKLFIMLIQTYYIWIGRRYWTSRWTGIETRSGWGTRVFRRKCGCWTHAL